jgi:Ice-binding-like
MNSGVPPTCQSPASDSLVVSKRSARWAGGKAFSVGSPLLGLLFTLLFASSGLGAPATVSLGTDASFSVLAGSTVTNTGPTTMFGDLGLSPGSSVTGAPQVLGATHVDDAVAIGAKNALTTAFNDAAGRPSNGSAGTDLAGQVFLPGVRSASSSLLLSAGSVTLDAQGDPNAVFVFQIGSTLITGSSTSVLLAGGAQACNVFWEVGSSATLGTGTRFVGTIMALATITANTAATIHGRLLARNGAVNLDTNTITTSNCASSGPGSTTTTGANGGSNGSGGSPTKTGPPRNGSRATGKHGSRHHHSPRAPKRHPAARHALPHSRSSFTG